MRHKWMNEFFRGVESRSKQTCKCCGLVKDNCHIPAKYYRNGKEVFTAAERECTTPAIEQMCAEAELASKQNNNYY